MASVPTIALEGGSSESIGDHSIFGVVTVSDRASQGIYDDESGPAIIQFFHEAIKSRWEEELFWLDYFVASR